MKTKKNCRTSHSTAACMLRFGGRPVPRRSCTKATSARFVPPGHAVSAELAGTSVSATIFLCSDMSSKRHSRGSLAECFRMDPRGTRRSQTYSTYRQESRTRKSTDIEYKLRIASGQNPGCEAPSDCEAMSNLDICKFDSGNQTVEAYCLRPESNWRHTDFQSVALPTELPRHTALNHANLA